MDIRCPCCGEPWDMDCLHEEVEHRGAQDEEYEEVYNQVKSDFFKKGCKALTVYGPAQWCNGAPEDDIAFIYDLMGDDLDGAAAFLEDMGY